jgi:SnoaL-like domain
MSVQAIGKRLVELCNAGEPDQAARELYAKDIVSIEANGSPEMPARMQGMAAIEQKSAWWNANNDVHRMAAEGPFIGNRPDQFAVRFEIDMTPKGGARTKMIEVGLYTVRGDKIAEEAFLYSYSA